MAKSIIFPKSYDFALAIIKLYKQNAHQYRNNNNKYKTNLIISQFSTVNYQLTPILSSEAFIRVSIWAYRLSESKRTNLLPVICSYKWI